jgi:GGDEF domain-containing protein
LGRALSSTWEDNLNVRRCFKAAPPERNDTARARFVRAQTFYPGKNWVSLLAAGVAVVLTVVLAIWLTPWVPIGMREDDYSSSVRVALVLTLSSALMSLIAAFTRGDAGRETEPAELWHSLLGKRMRLRDRRQFHNRLARECARAHRDRRSSLSLILVRVSDSEDRDSPCGPDVLERVADALMATVRSSDVIGIAGDCEIGILAIGADANAREVIITRFRRTLMAALQRWREPEAPSRAPLLSLGASTLGYDSAEPGPLLAAARYSLAPVIARSRRAA